MKLFFQKYGLFFAWLISLIALLATLFASEILSWPVCPLCWYQRIALYPLVILLGIAAFKDDCHIIPYALPFPMIGFFFAAYQYLEQMIPGFSPINFCKQGIVCSTIHLKLLGFITIPFLSMMACLIMILFLLLSKTDKNYFMKKCDQLITKIKQ
ncbi:MAG: disulfide bond formation protein B [Gammaproteobacteria bacterium CG_4_10_14_0_8_um_filter_38_16]|nr:MAG: disulfide bond formation protein B [Gammaproteobacteria bacterium CG_4_10_14_0_8_um_filter_38_16]PJA03477.1 MAG: disulfide bond formation protein B [Gammaproteobacteria bacterium CG_4_10_14_0_2_um_filter_38_22]PJB10632.1 MAG: disulfide bond formation protein B [Gammaproteobacteria bacterium CG_4_9_14_3_um_filter_38_9]